MAQIGILEDNARIAKLCATFLHYVGHQVTLYEHPQECLRALLPDGMSVAYKPAILCPLPVEVLILDLILPDIDGMEVLTRLQSHPSTRSLPLIVCSGASDAELARALHIAPNAVIVEKPFKIQSLTTAIATVLSTVAR